MYSLLASLPMGVLYIVATPIGNREDITLRALRILGEVNIVLCEDTRKTGSLLKHYRDTGAIDPTHTVKLISYYEENEVQRIPSVIESLQNGKSIALVSDAGTPLISDPGYKLVNECRKRNIGVVPIPGPSSTIAALSASGLPTDKFTFLGYLPKKQSKRKKLIDMIEKLKQSEISNTVILFESPHRLVKTLNELKSQIGDVPIVIARELTKMHEEFFDGTIQEAIDHFQKPKGEFVILA